MQKRLTAKEAMNHKYFDLVRSDIEKEMQQGDISVGMSDNVNISYLLQTRNPNEERLKQIQVFVTNNNNTLRSLH